MVRRHLARIGALAAIGLGGLGLAAALAPTSGATLTTPGAPTALAVTLGRGIGEVKLVWTAPADTGGGIGHYAISTATVTGGVTGAWSTPQTTGSIATRATRICGASYPDVCRYRVYAVNSAGSSTASNEVSMAWSAPTAASRNRAVPLSVHDFSANDVTWSAPSRTGGLPVTYDVQIRVDGGAWTDVATDLSVRTLADDAHCTGGTSCLYRVRAKNAVGFGPNSNSSALMVRPTVVTEFGVAVTGTDPTMANPTSGGTEVTVTWALPRAGLVDDDYEVAGCLNLCTATSGTWTSPVPVAGLSTVVPCGAGYRTCTYRVRATNSLGGVGSWSYRAVSPFGPSTVSAATGTAVDEVDVTFQGVAESGLGLIADKHFRFIVCTASCGSAVNWATDESEDVALSSIVAFPATATVACPAGTACQIRVQFVDGEGNESPLSAVTAATGADVPGDPTGLSVVTGSTSGTVDASWNAPTNLGTPALNQYQTRYSIDAGVTFSAWSNTGGTGTTRTISCGAGETCDVEVRAVNTIGTSDAATDSAVAAEAPGAPENLSVVTGSTSGTVDASWDAPTNLGTPALTEYQTRYSIDAGVTFSAWSNTGGAGTTRTISCGAGETCDVEVRAVNTIGSGASASDSAVAAEVPGAPENLSVVSGSTSGTVDASWDAPTNLGTPALTEYQTRYSIDAGVTFSAWSNTGGTGTTGTISCGAGETCDVEVRAVNTIGSGASASDSAIGADVPGQLTGFSAATYNASDTDLAWTLGSSNPAITDIEYQVSTDGGTTWGSWTSLSTTGSSATVVTCSAVYLDTCDYRVRAVNAIGNGPASATSGFTIQ